ncbi:hypothetical protein B0A55_01953 [Friedmanniomyces simplex]|uniref:Mid2 domain-containing protein n=1 Tax=Friedmanniomyces simplex TaxID=329884 RepID=A0A4U0XKP2_9PEZI|nr:hypothetical protein B0A55_01953 [Friedmanniomyces simplex]
MEVGMAPPHKRRKLSESDSRDGISFESEVGRPAPTPTFSHGVEHLSHAYATSDSRQVPQRIEEVHLQIHHQAVSVPDIHHGLHRRQGTGASSEPTLAVTVVASVNTDGSTTGLSTATDTAAASGVSSFASTATTTVEQYRRHLIYIFRHHLIHIIRQLDGHGDPDILFDIRSKQYSGWFHWHFTYWQLPNFSFEQFQQRLSLIIQDSRSHTTESSSKTLGAAFYLATLADGTVETFSRSSHSYITTFPDGSSATVPAATGSYVTATGTDGVTSVVYETTSAVPSSAQQSTITSVATIGGANQQGTATSSTSSSSKTSGASSGGGGNSNNATAPPGTIAGGVVGGAAGLAVILLIAMLFLRYYRRRSQLGHQALPPNAGVSPDPNHTANNSLSRPGPGMAERAGLMPALGVVPALFRHQNRSQEGAEPGSERSFTRVSGRKLPSSFSPGMSTSSPPPDMPLTGSADRNLSTTSFYRDSTGFYGGGAADPSLSPGSGGAGLTLAGAGAAGAAGTAGAAEREELTLSPGPQRRPTVHTGGPYVLSPPASSPSSPARLLRGGGFPGSPPGTAATFERSGTPGTPGTPGLSWGEGEGEGGRGSRFTEEV